MTEILLHMPTIMARQAVMNLGTLGNVSEGKSTFVRLLSGTATQKHQKEKKLNITIHLGYAGFKIWRHKETGDLSVSPSTVMDKEDCELLHHYSFVDCPGHEAYLATMLSGAAIMDAAALLIAANNEQIPQVQTAEHLMAAELMNLAHVFTIQNKLDIVKDPHISLEKIKAFSKERISEPGPIIPMSAQLGWGVEHVIHHLAYNIPQPERNYNNALRMMIVRSFDINKPSAWKPGVSSISGGVLGGSILRGVLQKDDIVEIRPGIWNGTEAIPLLTRVKSLYCESNELPFAIAGGLIGIGTSLDPRFTAANTLAGQVVGTPGTLPEITNKISGKFRAFKRDSYVFPKHKEGDEISFCVGIMNVKGKIVEVGKKSRVVRLETPVCVEPGQLCGILRSNGTRELLDGVLCVEKVKPFKHVRQWTEQQAQLASTAHDQVMARKYKVEESQARLDGEPLPSYAHMLDAIESLHAPEPDTKESVKFPRPIVARFPKQTLLVNAPAIVAAFHSYVPPELPTVIGAPLSYEEHFLHFIRDDLCTTVNIKAEGGYLIKGRFSEGNMRALIHKYIQTYHKCQQCDAYQTALYKMERIVKLYCGKCTASHSVAQLRG